MKRTLAVVVLATLAISVLLLVACGTPATPPPPVVQTVVVTVKETGAPVVQTVVNTVKETVVAQATVVQTVVAQPTPEPQMYAGQTVNVVTFTGPQIAEPLQRRGPDFEKLTGAKINVITVPFADLYQKILTDAATGTNSYDAYVFSPSWFADYVTPGYLEDLTDRIKNDKALQFDDIAPFFADYNMKYQGKLYALPLDGDFQMIYYRTDLLEKDGLKPPATWDDWLAIAKKYNGQDLNGDGQPDYGSCLFKKKGAQSFWTILNIAAPMLQSQGTSQGTFFNTENMQPLVNNAAFKKALEFYKETGKYAHPDELNQDLNDMRNLFLSGRCALGLDWGDIGALAIDPERSTVQDKVGAAIMPGWKEVLDFNTGKLVPCDEKTCPYAVNGVNHAPLSAFGGWSGSVNSASKVKDAAYAFLSYMAAPEQSNVDVTLGKSGFNPFRMSQFLNREEWVKAGMSPKAAADYLGAIEDSLNNPNMVVDLRIPQAQYYEQVVLDQAVAQYLAGELTVEQAMKQIEDAWNAKTDELGRDQQLAAYKASLGVAR